MALDRQGKLSRRIVIISVLVALSIWYLSDVLDFDKRELWGFVTSSFLLVLGVILAAIAIVASFKLFQGRARKKRSVRGM
jgi:H+/Cl- antiporter ClcA